MKAVLHVFVVNHEHPSGVAALQTPSSTPQQCSSLNSWICIQNPDLHFPGYYASKRDPKAFYQSRNMNRICSV